MWGFSVGVLVEGPDVPSTTRGKEGSEEPGLARAPTVRGRRVHGSTVSLGSPSALRWLLAKRNDKSQPAPGPLPGDGGADPACTLAAQTWPLLIVWRL